MKRVVVGTVIAAAIVMVGVAGAQKGEGRKGVFAPLEIGQQVGLKDGPNGTIITAVPGVALGHRVVEVGPDYLVLDDITGITHTRIPITAVQAVVISRIPRARER